MRASTLAADLVSVVVFLACISSILGLPNLGKPVPRREVSGVASHENTRYGLDDGPALDPGRDVFAHYPPPYGYQPPQSTSTSSRSESSSFVQSSSLLGSSNSVPTLSLTGSFLSSGGPVTTTGKLCNCPRRQIHLTSYGCCRYTHYLGQPRGRNSFSGSQHRLGFCHLSSIHQHCKFWITHNRDCIISLFDFLRWQ